jgi:mono/diheme cytochrome c family protein
MKKAIIGFVALALGASGLALRAQTPTRNAWDGVFTADQAAGGKTVFDGKCAACHGPDLAGGGEAPALTGTGFIGEWAGQSVGDLATRLHTTMPANDPGSLNNADTAAVVAYILSVNQFPAGTAALPADLGAMGSINITAEKPAAK